VKPEIKQWNPKVNAKYYEVGIGYKNAIKKWAGMDVH
jgi:hypothetical protein